MLQACGVRKTSSTRSMHGSSWRSRVLSSGLLHFSPVLHRQFDSRVVSAEPRRDPFFFSELHCSEDYRWAEHLSVVISPQFMMGKHNVLADAFSRPNQILGSEWTLKREVFRDLCRRWPVSIDLCATSQIADVPFIFLLTTITMLWGRMRFFKTGMGGRRMPPWSLIPAVLRKLRSSSGVLLTIVAPYWPQRPWFPDLLDLVVDGPVALPQSRDLLRQPHFHRFHLGVSRLCLHAWRPSRTHPRRWILRACSSAGFLSTMTIFAHRLPV